VSTGAQRASGFLNMRNDIRRWAVTALALSLAFAAFDATPAQSPDKGYCFGPDDAARAPFRIFRYPSRPPLSNAAHAYRYYPLTDSMGSEASLDDLGTTTNVRRNFLLWANLCDAAESNSCARHPANAPALMFANPPPRPLYFDPVSHREVGFRMASYASADACTMAQAAFALGYDDARVDGYARAGGLILVRDRSDLAKWRLDPDHTFTDVCVLPDARLSAAVKGVVLDYGVHDGRQPRAARDFLLAFAALVHGARREASLYTNPLYAPNEKLSGLDETNLNEVQDAFDMTTVLFSNVGRSGDVTGDFAGQLARLRGTRPVRPPVINFELTGTTMAQVRDVRALMLKYQLPAVIVAQKGAVLEGPCTSDANRKLRCLLDGGCEG
jgi:hypothetical protein